MNPFPEFKHLGKKKLEDFLWVLINSDAKGRISTKNDTIWPEFSAISNGKNDQIRIT